MEIRRCDKCKVELDPAIVKDSFSWWGDTIKAIRLEIPYVEVQALTDGQLDDKDEFEGPVKTFPKRKIDLCESCITSFGILMGNWLK